MSDGFRWLTGSFPRRVRDDRVHPKAVAATAPAAAAPPHAGRRRGRIFSRLLVGAVCTAGLLTAAAAEGKPAARSRPSPPAGKSGRATATATGPAEARTQAPSATAAPQAPSAAPAPSEPPQDLDADTQAELRDCHTSVVPGRAVTTDSGNRPALVVGRRRVFDRTLGYVCIPAYSISPKPVTQAQYELVTGVRPHGSDFAAGRPVFVSFLQAARYCNTLSLKERLTPCYEVRIDRQGKETIGWPNRAGCTGYRLPAAEEAAAYQRGTDSEWTWFSSTLPLGQMDARTDAPRGFYLARSVPAAPAGSQPTKRHAKR